MPNSKISALTSATTPLAGTETLPVVQSGVTKQVSVADLTAGRAVSALSLTLTNALTAANGGTGQSSYAVGDLLYASTTTALSKLADVATGNALISGGVGVAPSWGKIGLTTHVSGTLPIANGGTNQTSFTSPSSSIAALLYFDGTSLVNNATPSRLGFNASTNTFYGNTIVSGSANALFAGISGYTPQIQTHAGDTNSSGFGIFAFTGGGVGRYQINRSKSTTIGTNTALASGDVVGILQYGAADGTGYIDCADIRAYVDGAVSTNVVPGRLSFFTNTGTSVNPVEQVRIDSNANMTVLNGNIVQGTANKGINFTANSSAAGKTSQLLNWYEEGTFTPTLIGTTTNPTVTYSIQRGRYTRVGRLVTIECYVAWSAFTGGSGNVAVSGFPYTIDPSTGASGGGAVSYFDGFTLTAARTSVGILANANTTYASPTCMGSGVTTQYIPVGSVAASGLIIFTLTYSV